ncbi:uncharacterized protein LOC113146679 [Cyclospora cayetanensis]|uniref:Uncharacterized protein LOC113146679 n=1 Tax=Cyclospora cayetanensis TaxID=88456 RepID=A0A6P6RTW1_9EIME|nr:uncharacterized protein LOC113146679 [Cyclospora cayetanensis]
METLFTPVEVIRRFRALQLANNKARKQRLRLAERRIPRVDEITTASSRGDTTNTEGTALSTHRSGLRSTGGTAKQPRELFFISLKKQRARAAAAAAAAARKPAATKTSAVERTAADDDTPAAGWKGTSPPSCALQYDHDQQNSSPAGSFVVIQALPPDPLPTSTPLETPQHATHGVGSKGKQHEAADLELLLQQLSWALPQQQPSGRESSGETALGDGSDGADIVREQPLSAVAGGTALQTSPCGGFEAEEAHEALPLALLTLLEEHDRQATIAASEADKQALKRMRPAWLQRQLAAIREKTSVSAALRETPASRNASDTTTSDQPSAASALRSCASSAQGKRGKPIGTLVKDEQRAGSLRQQKDSQGQSNPRAVQARRRRQQQQPVRSTSVSSRSHGTADQPGRLLLTAEMQHRKSVEQLVLSLFKRGLWLEEPQTGQNACRSSQH